MQQKGVIRQYAVNENAVVPDPDELHDNAGEVCNAQNVAECIKDLMSLGYGGGKSPHELASEQASFRVKSWFVACC